MGKTIFRQKSMQKITSPEQMNDYIRVSNPSVWMILAAVIVLLAGVCVWGVFGHLDTVLQTGGVCKDGRLVVYIGEKDFAEIGENTVFSVNGSEYALSNLDDTPVQLDENFDSYLIHLIGLSEGDWVSMRIIRTTEAPRWVQNVGDACLTLEEYFNESLFLWQKYAQGDHNMKLTVWQFGTLYPKSKFYTLTAVNSCTGEYRDSAPVCKGNRGMVAVAANGNVFPCHQMSGYYEQHGDTLGNVKQIPLSQLLSGGKYIDEVCTTLGTLREKNEKCGKCEYFEHCNGGCRAIALALTGDKLGIDPSKCLFWGNGYDKKISEHLSGYSTVI